MGWERKRGKLEELNRLLRGATDTSFTVQVGDLSILPSFRHVLTLDTDSRLPRNAARTLIGILSHPLNRPSVDPVLGRVTEGYGILQPRVSVTLASAAGSLFRASTPDTPASTLIRRPSRTRTRTSSARGLHGKRALRRGRLRSDRGRTRSRERPSLHDLFEGLYARTALVSDVEVVDEYPSNVLAHAGVSNRWVRGDWQILAWLLPVVPTRTGFARNRPAADQPVEDPRQPSAQPRGGLRSSHCSGGSGASCRARPAGLDAGSFSSCCFPLATALARFSGRARKTPARMYVRGFVETTGEPACAPGR